MGSTVNTTEIAMKIQITPARAADPFGRVSGRASGVGERQLAQPMQRAASGIAERRAGSISAPHPLQAP